MRIYNPYAGVGTINWDRDANISGDDVIAHKSENHLHVGQPFDSPDHVIDFLAGERTGPGGYTIDEGDEYTVFQMNRKSTHSPMPWPWTELSNLDSDWSDRDPEQLGVIAYPGAEWDHPEHVLSNFSTLVDDDMGDNWPESEDGDEQRLIQIDTTIEESGAHVPSENGGLAAFAHPYRYWDNPLTAWRKYKTDLDKWSTNDGLIGIEVFQRAQSEIGENEGIRLWDQLLNYTAPNRLLWSIGTSDGSNDPNQSRIGYDLNMRFNTILLTDDEFNPADQNASRVAAASAFKDGRMLCHRRKPWDPDTEPTPTVPKVTEISADHEQGTIILAATDYDSIEWVSRGRVVDTGESINITAAHYPYVRARLEKNPEGETFTQPFGVGDKDIIMGEAEIGEMTHPTDP